MPAHSLNAEQKAVYEWQRAAHDRCVHRGLAGWIATMARRMAVIKYYTGLAPLLALPGLLFAWRTGPLLGAIAATALLITATTLYGFFDVQYATGAAGLILLIVLLALAKLRDWSPVGTTMARLLVTVVVLRFGIVTGVFFLDQFRPGLARSIETPWLTLRSHTSRSDVVHTLNHQGGRHLVFIQYSANHVFFDEWVYNGADPAHAAIIWARSIRQESDAALAAAFPGRRIWSVQADDPHPQLRELRPSVTSRFVGSEQPAHSH